MTGSHADPTDATDATERIPVSDPSVLSERAARARLAESREQQRAINRAVERLAYGYDDRFPREVVAAVFDDSYRRLAASASVTQFLPTLSERLTRERLDARAQAEGKTAKPVPEVLFVCVRNAGRSQMAAALARHHAGGRLHIRTGGSDPGERIHPEVVHAMKQIGLSLDEEFPKPLTDEVVAAADVVVTMGCGDRCPYVPGRRYEDWPIPDPDGATAEQVADIRDDLDRRVRDLVHKLPRRPLTGRLEGNDPMHLVAVGGSDAGISAALRARELDPAVDVTVVVADAYPNFSICGIPYYISGEVGHWRNLAHRTVADLQATGMRLRLDTTVTAIDVPGRRLTLRGTDGQPSTLGYDALVVGTGAVPVRPPIDGLRDSGSSAALGPADGVHLLHSMGDTFDLQRTIEIQRPRSALIVGAGYVGLEMAEGLTARGLQVTQVEMLPEVLPTVDPQLGRLVRDELTANGVQVVTGTTVTSIRCATDTDDGGVPPGRLVVAATDPDGRPLRWRVDLVLVAVGVRPDTDLLVAAGAGTGARGAVAVDDTMATGLPRVWAAGDCVVTRHRQLGVTYLPLGTTAHKQGRVAGENAIGGTARFAGSLGTQVVKVFDTVAARTGLRDSEATAAGLPAATVQTAADDHKAYYPGANPITIRVTGDPTSGRLLGAQLVGRRGSEIAKRVDTYATALFHGMTLNGLSDLDLSYTPPLGAPWDAVQAAAQVWVRETRPAASTPAATVPPT